MFKKKSTYSMVRPISIIPYIVAPDEIFVPINNLAISNIKPYYLISNYGRIYNIYTKTFMMYIVDTKGYLSCNVMTTNGHKMIRVHRAEMLCFKYIEGCEKLVVDHVNGNKLDPRICNLEWVTQEENNKRRMQMIQLYGHQPPQVMPAYLIEDKLRMEMLAKERKELFERIKAENANTVPDYSQKNVNSMKELYNCQSSSDTDTHEYHSDEQVHQICKMLQDGYTMSYIGTSLHVKKSYVSSIYYKKTRQDISDQYDFSNYGSIEYNDKWQFTIDEVNAICDYLSHNNLAQSSNKKQFIRIMFSILGIEYSESKYRSVLDIIKGRGYVSVASKYNILR